MRGPAATTFLQTRHEGVSGRRDIVNDRLPNPGRIAGLQRRNDPKVVFVRMGQIVGVLEEFVEERTDLAPQRLNELLQQRQFGSLVDEEMEFLVEDEVGPAVALRDRRIDVLKKGAQPTKVVGAHIRRRQLARQPLQRASYTVGSMNSAWKVAVRRSTGSAAFPGAAPQRGAAKLHGPASSRSRMFPRLCG